MENLVYGISSINFEHNEGITKENCAPNQLVPTILRASSSTFSFVVDPVDDVCDFNSLPPVSISHFETLAMSTNHRVIEKPSTSTEATNISSSNESDTEDQAYSPIIKEPISRRMLPARASKESNLLSKTKRRSIMKPSKRGIKSAGDFTSLRPADIKKIYLNKKLTNFHPAKLETIFEEPQTEPNDAESQVRFIGARKLKRSLSFCDGINMNKTLIKQRRLKIKKSFGRRFALKKISLDDFLQRLNRSFDSASMDEEDQEVQHSTETETNPPSPLEEMDAEESKDMHRSGLKNEAEAQGCQLLLPLADVGCVVMKSNSFSDDRSTSQPANTNIALR